MNKRMLWGCVAALATLLVFALLAFVFDASLNKATLTRVGEIPWFDLLGVLTSAAVGAYVARQRFRWVAVVLMGVVWLLTVGVVANKTLPGNETVSLLTTLRYNGLAIVLTMGLSWLGAVIGERLLNRTAFKRGPATDRASTT